MAARTGRYEVLPPGLLPGGFHLGASGIREAGKGRKEGIEKTKEVRPSILITILCLETSPLRHDRQGVPQDICLCVLVTPRVRDCSVPSQPH